MRGYYTERETNNVYTVLQEGILKLEGRWVEMVVFLKDDDMYCMITEEFNKKFRKNEEVP